MLLSELAQIETEPDEFFGRRCLHLQFLGKLSTHGYNVILAGVNGTAEAPPVAGIENPRNIVTQLHEIPAVLDRYDRGNGVFAVQWAIVGQEMLGQHDRFSD